MTVSWAIEMGMEEGYEEALVESAKVTGAVWHPKFIPSSLGGGLVKTTMALPTPVVFHGSLQGAKQVRELGLPWVVWENTEQLRCRYYYPRLTGRLLNYRYAFLPYGSLQSQWPWLLKSFGEDDCVFVRPDSNRKVFTGMLVRGDHWREDYDLMGFYDVTPEEMVVVTVPRTIKAEYRFFVTQDKVITGSQYRVGQSIRHRVADDEEMAVAEDMRKWCLGQGYCPDPVWVLDLCQVPDGGWRILEVGGFSSAGLYAADTDALVAEVNRLVEQP